MFWDQIKNKNLAETPKITRKSVPKTLKEQTNFDSPDLPKRNDTICHSCIPQIEGNSAKLGEDETGIDALNIKGEVTDMINTLRTHLKDKTHPITKMLDLFDRAFFMQYIGLFKSENG